MNTVVGLFENRAKARRAKSALIRAHIASPNIYLHDRSAGASSRESESLWEFLRDSLGFAEDRSFYEEAMRRGGTVVSVRINDEQMDQAAEILSREGAIEQGIPAVQEQRQGAHPEVGKGTVRVYKRAA
jgi:general stress protein YciG